MVRDWSCDWGVWSETGHVTEGCGQEPVLTLIRRLVRKPGNEAI